MRSIDSSMLLFERMPAFPGDPAFVSERAHSIDRGDPYNLSTLRFGSHVGTHVDPPSHFLPSGLPIDRVDRSALNGPCRAVEVSPGRARVGPRELREVLPGTERLLERATNSLRWRQRLEYLPDYVAFAPEGAEARIGQGTHLAGIDSLSIERDPLGRSPVHHRLLGSGVSILEGRILSGLPAGADDLRCLALRLWEGDGGPTRALLPAL